MKPLSCLKQTGILHLEALANEGMLELIPLEYYREKVLLTAMGVIFEDPGNIARNWRVLDEYLHLMTSSACPC